MVFLIVLFLPGKQDTVNYIFGKVSLMEVSILKVVSLQQIQIQFLNFVIV